jgi:polysaccharide pyruvyl transferase WcaK-like protein
MLIGVGVMAYYGWKGDPANGKVIYDKYIGQIVEFIMWVLECGHNVRLLMGDTDDKHAITAVQERLAKTSPLSQRLRIVVEDARSLQDVMKQMAETDVVVASRFHNIVCSLKLSRPTISIGYAKKNDVLMTRMGMGEFCQSIEGLDVDRLKRQLVQLLAEGDRYFKYMCAANAAILEDLRRQEQLLLGKVL